MMAINLEKSPMPTTTMPMTEVPMTATCPSAVAPTCAEGMSTDCFAGVTVESSTLGAAGALARGSVRVADSVACTVEGIAGEAVEVGLEAVETVGAGMLDAGSNVMGSLYTAYEMCATGVTNMWHWMTGR